MCTRPARSRYGDTMRVVSGAVLHTGRSRAGTKVKVLPIDSAVPRDHRIDAA